MLSRDCDGCAAIRDCKERYRKVGYLEKVYCPDGTRHLVDGGSPAMTPKTEYNNFKKQLAEIESKFQQADQKGKQP